MANGLRASMSRVMSHEYVKAMMMPPTPCELLRMSSPNLELTPSCQRDTERETERRNGVNKILRTSWFSDRDSDERREVAATVFRVGGIPRGPIPGDFR
eukprot:1184914-Prorocentrum_minimum.AAC.1